MAYQSPMSTPLISMERISVWSAIFFSSLVYVLVGTMRWSNSVFRLFLRRRRRRSPLVSPVSSSSSSPSPLISPSSKSVLSLGDSDSERSASDGDCSPSSAMCSDGRLRCLRAGLTVGMEAPAREEDRRRAARSLSILERLGGCVELAAASDRGLSEGSRGSVCREKSSPGLPSGAAGALFCAASQRPSLVAVASRSSVIWTSPGQLRRDSPSRLPRRWRKG